MISSPALQNNSTIPPLPRQQHFCGYPAGFLPKSGGFGRVLPLCKLFLNISRPQVTIKMWEKLWKVWRNP